MNGLYGYIKLLEGDERLTVLRPGGAVPNDITYVDGLPVVQHALAKFVVQATVQPMGGRDLMMLPEAFREKNMLALWQAHRTPGQDVIRVTVSDIVLFRGNAFQVQAAEDWDSYTKATLCGIDLGSFAGDVDVDKLPTLYPAAPVVAPTPTPTPAPTEELDMDIGPLYINEFYSNPGDVYDFRGPGDGNNTFKYVMPRAGKMTGYTITGQAPLAQFGCYVQTRVAASGQYVDALFLDPAAQPTYDAAAGQVMTFASPLTFAKGDLVILKWKINQGIGQVDVFAMLQITLDPTAST